MVLVRTAKSCGSDAPMPASSLREAAQATVSNKHGHRGEHEVSRKTIARGMPVISGVTVVTTLVCFFHLHARLRVHWVPGIPCALCYQRGEQFCKTRAKSRREIAKVCVKLCPRHCEEQGDISRHSGAMRSIEPGISRFPDVQLHI